MYFIPLIYFCCLGFYFWQKHRTFDMAVYMCLLYTITSLCCLLMVLGGFLSAKSGGVLVDGWEPNFGIAPTILYCGLITLTILPFSFIRPEQMVHIDNIHRYSILAFTVFIVIQGLLVFYLVGGSITDLLNGDFKELKNAGYAGDITPADAKMLTMPLPIQAMYLLSNITLLGQPLFFYYSCVEKRSLWYTAPILLISASPILRGILSADRTEIIHFGLMFFFCLIFFQQFITKKIGNFLLALSVPALIISLVYIFAVSTSRFEDSDEGAGGSMLEYAGQSYLNFCYFYDNHNSDLYYFEREFPLTSYFLFKSQYVDTKEERTAKEGFFVGVFASHIGSWYLDTGVFGCIIISGVFFLICCMVIKQFNRREFDIGDVLIIYALGAIPTFGIFYYRYYSSATAFVYAVAFALYFLSKYRVVWTKKEEAQKVNKTL